MVGSSRETVTRTLSGMERSGLIAIERRQITLLPAFFSAERARGA
jgi:CRP-like cAMP-binding protein